MIGRTVRRLLACGAGAVAPTVALSLFALIAAGGIAFDYSRMATLDTELQTAADQAALAAASQLDGVAGAQTRATSAAQTLISNPTAFASDIDSKGTSVAITSLVFYVDKAKATVATGDTDSNFVLVTVESRRADFAFTPIVAAMGVDVGASAFAGVGSAICGVVPFFICNPVEPSGNSDPYYPPDVASGVGIQMLEGGDQKGPGNYGFLAYAGRGAKNLEEALSADALKEECSEAATVETEPGQKTSVFDGLNRRFDMTTSCPSGPCSPSTNERKGLVRKAGNCNWAEPAAINANFQSKRYRPTTNAALVSTITPEIMGHPRDTCHSVSDTSLCTKGQIGDGVWDRAAYFRSNHPGLDWLNTAGLGASVTRYQTYLWEAQDTAARLTTHVTSADNTLAAYGTPQAGQCLYPGVSPSGPIDRRRLTAAVINCRAYGKINGRKTLPVAGFVDVFLVEPSIDRKRCDDNTSNCKTTISNRTDIYVEVIGTSGTGEGGATAQITRRDVPYLIE